MTIDPRDQLWDATFRTYYLASYQEVIANILVERWQLVDELTKITVAFTASTSAVSGWVLWTKPEFHNIWSVVAGFGAAVAILHATLGVPHRLRNWGDVKRSFTTLHNDISTHRDLMCVDPEFPVDEYKKAFVEFRKRYTEQVSRLSNDIFLTKRLRVLAQNELNARIKDQIAIK